LRSGLGYGERSEATTSAFQQGDWNTEPLSLFMGLRGEEWQ